jgi:hypothetical protein
MKGKAFNFTQGGHMIHPISLSSGVKALIGVANAARPNNNYTLVTLKIIGSMTIGVFAFLWNGGFTIWDDIQERRQYHAETKKSK